MSEITLDGTTPQGPVEFTLYPESKKNSKVRGANGTMESVSLKVKGTSLLFALRTLLSINKEQGVTLTTRILSQCLTQLGIAEEDKKEKSNSRLLKRELKAKKVPFRSFTFSITGEGKEEVTFTITAPSYIDCISYFVVMAAPQKIGNIISTLKFFESYNDNWDDDYNYDWEDSYDEDDYDDYDSGLADFLDDFLNTQEHKEDPSEV